MSPFFIYFTSVVCFAVAGKFMGLRVPGDDVDGDEEVDSGVKGLLTPVLLTKRTKKQNSNRRSRVLV